MTNDEQEEAGSEPTWYLSAEDSRLVLDILLTRRALPGLRGLLAETVSEPEDTKGK